MGSRPDGRRPAARGPPAVRARRLNGAGPGVRNDNIDLAYAARIVAAPFGPVAAVARGTSRGTPRPLRLGRRVRLLQPGADRHPAARTGDPNATNDVDDDGRIDNVAIWQGGVELRAIWRGAALQAEWFGRLEDPGAAGSVAQLLGRLRAGELLRRSRTGSWSARASGRPTCRSTASTAARAGAARRPQVDEQSAVVSAYLRGNRAKLQVDYSHLAARRTPASAPDVQPGARRRSAGLLVV